MFCPRRPGRLRSLERRRHRPRVSDRVPLRHRHGPMANDIHRREGIDSRLEHVPVCRPPQVVIEGPRAPAAAAAPATVAGISRNRSARSSCGAHHGQPRARVRHRRSTISQTGPTRLVTRRRHQRVSGAAGRRSSRQIPVKRVFLKKRRLRDRCSRGTHRPCDEPSGAALDWLVTHDAAGPRRGKRRTPVFAPAKGGQTRTPARFTDGSRRISSRISA